MNKQVPERRASTRLVTHCEAEVVASLTILDNDADETDDELMFFGKTSDLSIDGLGIVLPSARIDERFCADSHQIKVRLHLPRGRVQLQIITSRCARLLSANLTPGYLLAGRIITGGEVYADYVNSLS